MKYRSDLEDIDNEVDPSARAVRFLNMLMNLTRTHGHTGDHAVFIKKLEGRQSVKGEQLQKVLAVLEHWGIVRIEGQMLYITKKWEQHRYSGKTLQGRRLLQDVWTVWQPVVKDIETQLE